jgi:hypothetical protein
MVLFDLRILQACLTESMDKSALMGLHVLVGHVGPR